MRADMLHHLSGQLLAEGRSAVLVTIVETRGSTPRKAGSQMLLMEDGSFLGTIGGGQGEARSLALAREALIDKRSSLHRLSMNSSVAADEGMACGGDMLVFVQYVGQN